MMSHSKIARAPTGESSSPRSSHEDENKSNANASPVTNLTFYSPEMIYSTVPTHSKGKGKAPTSDTATPSPGAHNVTYNIAIDTINGNGNGVYTNGVHAAPPFVTSAVNGLADGNNDINVGAAGPSDPYARLASDPRAMSLILDHFNMNAPNPTGSGPASPQSSTSSARITPIEEQVGAIGELPQTPIEPHMGERFTAKSTGAIGVELSRYVMVRNISMEEEKIGTALSVFSESEAFREAISHAKTEVRVGGNVYYEYVFAFDDFSTACLAVAEPALTSFRSWVPLFIDRQAYLSVHHLHHELSPAQEYEGLVKVLVFFLPHATGLHSLRAARSIVLRLARYYGAVRGIRLLSQTPPGGPDATFLVEFDSLSSSRVVARYLQQGPTSIDGLYGFEGHEYTGNAPRATSSNGPAIAPTRIQVPAPLGNRVNSTDNNVSPERIARGLDVRTTIMLRNIPNRVDAATLKHFLDKACRGRYDFSYLRIDFKTGLNVGYAFINFLAASDILLFYKMYAGKPFFNDHSNRPSKKVQMSYATCQGIECLTEKFRNSVVMQQFAHYRPQLWWTVEDNYARAGEPKDFPPPNNKTKLDRSAENVRATGLFAPRTANHANGRGRLSNFDRGTPRAAAEEAQATSSRTQAHRIPPVQPSDTRDRLAATLARHGMAVPGPSNHASTANGTARPGPSSQVSSTHGTHGCSPQVSHFGFTTSVRAYAGPGSTGSATGSGTREAFADSFGRHGYAYN